MYFIFCLLLSCFPCLTLRVPSSVSARKGNGWVGRLKPKPNQTRSLHVPTMRASAPDITRALVNELKTLREKHQQFQTRVKAADKAARARDEQARKENAILTQRITGLEDELKHAKASIEVRFLSGSLRITLRKSSLHIYDRHLTSSLTSCHPSRAK